MKARHPLIYFINPIGNLKLSNDGVHLEQESGERYLNEVIERSLKKWVTPIDEPTSEAETEINLSQEEITIDDETFKSGAKRKRGRPPTSTVGSRFKPKLDEAMIDSVNKRLDHLEFSNNKTMLFIAKHEEALDTIRNEKNMNKIIFSGIEIENLIGKMEVKKPIILNALTTVMKAFMNEEDIPTIQYVVHLNDRFKTNFKVIEARFETPAEAKRVRETFGAKVRDWKVNKLFPDALKGVGINLCHTRETRIRIEVMKALAKVVNRNSDRAMEAYVLPFLARPLLKLAYNRPDGEKNIRSYGYTEAISAVTSMHDISDQDLHQAYKIAGSLPDLEQKFLILRTGFNSVKGWKGQGSQLTTGNDGNDDDEPEDKRLRTSKK